jgi:hypothetical protein
MNPPKRQKLYTPQEVRAAQASARISKHEEELARVASVRAKYAAEALKLAKIAQSALLELAKLEENAREEAGGLVFSAEEMSMDNALFTVNHVCAAAQDID